MPKRKIEALKGLRIFHHNLQNYSGGREPIFTGYNRIQTGSHLHFRIAGFTEVRSENAYNDIRGLAQALDRRLKQLVMIEVGQNAGGDRAGRREYIGIAWDGRDINVSHAGIVMPDAVSTHGWLVQNEAIGNPERRIIRIGRELNTVVDFRGLGYIAGMYEGSPFLLGFMHNVFTTGSRSTAFSNLGPMADSARIELGGAYRNAQIIIGGDFNVRPRKRKNNRSSRGLLDELYAENEFGPINTTRSNPYDFFLVSNPDALESTVDAYLHTRRDVNPDLGDSDHAAISLDYQCG